MNRRDFRPLDPVVLSLLASEKIPVAQPDDVKARAFSQAALTAAQTLRSPPRLRWPWSGLRARIALVAAGAVLAVAAVGSAAYHAWQSPALVTVDQNEPAPSDVARTPRAPAVPRSGPEQQVPVKPASIDAEQVAKELRLLAGARIAVARGDYTAALAVISEHGRRFPSGPLAEEREALRVRSLQGLGRDGDARRAAAAFQARFPRSVFLSHMNEVSQKPGRY